MDYTCIGIRRTINVKGESKTECHKHFCTCEGKSLWDDKLNERYQKAKKKGKASNGIFYNK